MSFNFKCSVIHFGTPYSLIIKTLCLSPSAIEMQRCVTQTLKTSSIQLRMGLPRYCVNVLCSFFHEWMCPCTFHMYRDFFVLFGLVKNSKIFCLKLLHSCNFLVFVPLMYSKFLSVGDLVNWTQGQFCNGVFFDEQLFCQPFEEHLAWHFR